MNCPKRKCEWSTNKKQTNKRCSNTEKANKKNNEKPLYL